MMIRRWRAKVFCVLPLAIAIFSFVPRSYAQAVAELPQQSTGQSTEQASVQSSEQASTQSSEPQPEQQSGQQPPAQQAPAQTPAPSATPGQATGSQKPGDTSNSGSNAPSQLQADQGTKDRLFFAMPNFLSLENSAHVPPMTVKQKFQVSVRSSFDWFQYPWYGALAGISQARNSEPGYGQGAEGYAKRYGSQFADGTIENFMVNAVV